MKLTPEETRMFYAAWWPLLHWVNAQHQVLPGAPPISEEQPIPPQRAVAIRDVLWANDGLRETFIEQNPTGLSQELLDLIAGWRYRRADTFTVWKHYKKHTVFFGEDNQAFAVLGLWSALEEVIPMPPPCLVKAVLLPFGERIITDGLLVGYNVYLGSGIRGNLQRTWRDIRERRALVTSLLPESPEQERVRQRRDREGTNRDVLKAFRKHLFQKGLSERIVERDLATATALARAMPESSLRECAEQDLGRLLHQAPARHQKPTRTGLVRLVQFLRDTERMDWEDAEELRFWLRTR